MVLFVGRLVEIKGVAYLIEAIKKIDALLVIAGDGPLRKELERQAADIKNRVLFLGAKPHDELKTIYASSDIFVVPSITIDNGVQEGVPTVIMEAMASGLAVVASDSGGISALVHDGQNGLLCEERNSPKLAKNIKKQIKHRHLSDNMIIKFWLKNSWKYIKTYYQKNDWITCSEEKGALYGKNS